MTFLRNLDKIRVFQFVTEAFHIILMAILNLKVYERFC